MDVSLKFRKLRYIDSTTRSFFSTTILLTALRMLMSKTYTSSFIPNLMVHSFPAANNSYKTRYTDHMASPWSERRFQSRRKHRRSGSPIATDVNDGLPPVLVTEGVFAVDKPLKWTSQDVVSRIRGMFERDARARGADPGKIGSKKNKGRQVIRCGHGGTLDPLATGVLVIGLGSGTKVLQSYLTGSKGYRAEGTFGFETESLDMGTNVTKEEKFDHITRERLEEVIPQFKGKYLQDPPMYSAIHKDGQRLYELARKGVTAEDVDIKARAVEVYELDLIDFSLPKFEVEVFSASGFYIRSLIRDIGYSMDSVATTTKLQRIKQGPFTMEHVLSEEDWTVEKINEAIEKVNASFATDPPVKSEHVPNDTPPPPNVN